MALAEGIVKTRVAAAVVLIRQMVGAVFLSEGIQKFLFPATLGVGRFTTICILKGNRGLLRLHVLHHAA